MILRAAQAALLLSFGTFVPFAAQADVLEIGAGGEAQWITGPQAQSARTSTVPASDVPAEAAALAERGGMLATLAHQPVPAAYAGKVAELAARYDLSPALIEALVWQESRWRAQAVSPVGARGLAQLMPGTARELGVNPDDPFANLEGGARYLREQLDRFDGDVERALAAYNAGPGRVVRANGIPAIRETQNYVAAVMGRLSNPARSPE
jgi:soluble lytic murein transglycosylase-like protein